MSHDDGATCLCMVEHRPAPLEYVEHHVVPTYLGGPDTPENRVWLCPTTHYNVHELLREFLRQSRVLTFRECSRAWGPPVSEYAWQIARRGYIEWKREGL